MSRTDQKIDGYGLPLPIKGEETPEGRTDDESGEITRGNRGVTCALASSREASSISALPLWLRSDEVDPRTQARATRLVIVRRTPITIVRSTVATNISIIVNACLDEETVIARFGVESCISTVSNLFRFGV